MKGFKLTIDLLPKGAWGNDFSKTLSKKNWDILRDACYKRANYKCEICGYETNDLDAHEVWNFDINSKTQTLKDIVALCSKCHGVKHIRNSERLGYAENAKRHFLKVNNCTEMEFASHLAYAQLLFEERNEVYRWNIKADLENFGGKGIEVKTKYIPKIINPYTKDELTELENDATYNPRILLLDVNNYNGIITIICDRTNKIEWIGENLHKTKFNFARRFVIEFSVEDLKIPCIWFKLSGEYGQTLSKEFKLMPWE